MADYDEELSEIESEVDRLTRQVSGYERVGQSSQHQNIWRLVSVSR